MIFTRTLVKLDEQCQRSTDVKTRSYPSLSLGKDNGMIDSMIGCSVLFPVDEGEGLPLLTFVYLRIH